MENTELEEQKINTNRKRSYSDHNMVKLAYRFNKKKLEQLKDNKNIFGKDISEFISIINELSVSLPNFINYLKKYFSTLQMKITLLINQINYVKNSNINIMTKEKEIIEDKIEDNEKVIDEEIDLLFHNFESINDFDDFIRRKKEELNNLLNESIIKEINKKYNKFKLEKNKLLIKLQNIIDDIIKIKENINNVIDKSKNVEDLEMQKDNNDDLKILQNFFTSFEKEYNSILNEIKTLNQDTLNFIYEELNKYFELAVKVNEEIKEEINRRIIGNKNAIEDENKFLVDKIKLANKKIQKDIKQYVLLNNDNRINESMKSKSFLSRIGDVMLIAPEYFIVFNNFDNDDDDNNKKYKEDDDYNKDDLSTLKKVFNELKSEEVISDESLNTLFGILGNVSDKKKYKNLCLHFVEYINENSNFTNLKYNNVENFIFVSNMLNIICHNCEVNKANTDGFTKEEFDKNRKYYRILDNIIKIGNDSFIGNKYMCSLLKSIDILKDIKTFKYCFKSNLISEIKKSLKKIEKNVNPVQNVIDLFNNKIISSYNKFDYIEEIGLDNYIDSYKKLSFNEKINFNNNEFLKIVNNSLKKYIIYMINYDIEKSIIVKFIKSLSDHFSFSKEIFVNYYLIYYKSSLNSIKKYLFQSKSENIKLLEKIKQIKQKANSTEDITNKNNNKDKKILLNNILPFLDINQKISLMHLNKDLNMKKYCYKSILNNNILLPIEKRLKIWEIILFNKETKKIKYKENIKEWEKLEDYKVITDDTKRTSLINKDKEKTKEIVKNILCCFISSNIYDIRYCQGMNFIVAVIYDLTNNEEISYLLFKSLIENTNLKIIYDKKFELLHNYFYILDRLISFFLPLLRQKFDEIQMNIDCFVSPYFLTLFSNVYILNNNCKKFIIFIFENFMLNGWKIIFKSILALLKYNEEEILNKKEEGEILTFVIKNLRESNIFLDDNFEKFLKIYNNFHMNNNLINNLKEEYNMENEIKNELNMKAKI